MAENSVQSQQLDPSELKGHPTIDPGSLDAPTLSALLASRLCHDLINPVGALGSGLEVLDEDGVDEGMRDAALELIRTGGAKSISLLKYARLAYGASGGRGVEIPMEEAGEILSDLYQWSKADLVWSAPAGQEPKDIAKSVMILTHYASECVPRGGTVTVEKGDREYRIEADGKRALLQDDLTAALKGDSNEIKPKFAPAYLVGLLMRGVGGSASVGRVCDEKIAFSVRF